ncbi:MAG: M15 family metallopeptidase [Clostridia bacterium]|nr:M15 family metallopeptidase [Clostridia bacterium]
MSADRNTGRAGRSGNAAGRTRAAGRNANRPAGARGTPVKRKKKKKSNGYLYAAVFFCFAALAVAAALIYYSAAPKDRKAQEASSQAEQVSSPGANTSSQDTLSSLPAGGSEAESADPVSEAEESEPEAESSAAVSQPEEPAGELKQLQKTKEYEDKVGVKYSIDMSAYEQYVCPDDEEKYVFLVGPQHPLAADFVPDDLIKCTHMRENRPEGYSYIVRTVDMALDAFIKEAEAYGHYGIGVTNGYRSYATQTWLFNSYVDKEWESGRFATKEEAIDEVLTYSTRPGTSEHQSGLCCDMNNVDLSDVSKFNNSPTAKWMEENACRFGFILRYPEGKQDITGIIYESWHFRFVGRTAATEIHDLGITLDEYLADRA